MAKPPKLVDKIIGIVFQVFINVILAMPTRWIYRFIGTVSILAYKYSKRHTRFARLNLRMCFPSLFDPKLDMNDASDVQLERFIRRNYRQMFWAYIEGFIGKRKNTRTSIHKYMNLVIHDETRQLLMEREKEIKSGKTPRGMIFNVGHAGSWEIIGHTIASLSIPLSAVARPLDITEINRAVDNARERFGMKIISKFGGMVAMTRAILRGESLMLAIDQDAGVYDTGIYARFFGHWCKCIESYANLALKYNVPIIPIYGFRHGENFKFTMIWDKPMYPKGDYKNLDDIYKVVQEWHEVFAAQVLHYPHQYEWYHKKWRTRPVDEENVKRPFELDDQTRKNEFAELKKNCESDNSLMNILERYKEQAPLFQTKEYFGKPYCINDDENNGES